MKVAVILAGGRGERMRPLSESLHKSLAPIGGRPALLHILEQLEKFGFQKAIILSGHLGFQLDRFIQSIRTNLIINLELVESPANYSTAQRLIEASTSWIKYETIYLLYCDNIIEDKDIQNHFSDTASSSVVVTKRTVGNMKLRNGFVQYFPERSSATPFVELGYWKLNSNELKENLEMTNNLPSSLARLTRSKNYQALIVESYSSISNFSNYRALRSDRKTVFLDRDGIINKNTNKGSYIRNVGDIQYLDRNLKELARLALNEKVDYIVVSNQAGVERGLLSEMELSLVNQEIAISMLIKNIPILAFYCCPHHWESGCTCRKPKPGLLIRAMGEFNLNPKHCVFIGDTLSDEVAGQKAGIASFIIEETKSEKERATVFRSISRVLSEC